MATIPFDHPQIDWDSADLYQEFIRFRNHVEFVFDGPLSTQKDKEKAGWLGTWIGHQGREIYKTLSWNEGEKADPVKVLDKLENYVRPRKNKRIARHKLKLRKQSQEESFDNFVKDLRLILMDCEYADPDDILIDSIIDGVHAKKLQEKLLYQGEDLTLASAIKIGQQYELSQKQVRFVRDEDLTVLALGHKDKRTKQKTTPQETLRRSKQPQTNEPSKRKNCYRCGKDPQHGWSQGKCPALGSTCSYCKKPNHWRAVCSRRLRMSKLDTSSEDGSDTEVLNIHTAQLTDIREDYKWTVKCLVENKLVKFRIDTGARCNTLTLKDYQKIPHKGELKKSSKLLRTYSNHQIKPIATANLSVKHNEKSLTIPFELVNLEQENVLSGSSAEALKLISRLSSIDTPEHSEINELPKELHDFPELTHTTGNLPGTYTIKLQPNVKGVVHPARRLPLALKNKAINKLREMEADGHITKVKEPTEWVSSMVVATRGDKIRICIDPSDLNKVIKREHYPMKLIEEVVAEMPDAKVFSKLDAKSGFLQIELDKASSLLTTFNTPIGRYRWLRLPFGLKCAPEIFQRIMDEMLEGIEGATAIMDDILIVGRDLEQHDAVLRKVIERATSYNLKLNLQKCLIRQPEVAYIGHRLTPEGLKPDPSKVTAVHNMPTPLNKEDLKRFLGFVTYLAKFIPNLSELDAPLRELLKNDVLFDWQPIHEEAFGKLKEQCCNYPVLKYYDVNKPVEIQCDASQHGLGAVLIQEGRPVAYSSRSLSEVEKRYAQIEKEMLSIVHACRKFHSYIFGKETTVYNDHKPLEQIFKKPLLAAPMRLQRMRLNLQQYDLDVVYRKGKEMNLPDTLSRAHLTGPSEPELDNLEQVSALDFLSVTKEKYNEIQQSTQCELNQLQALILSGWPDTRQEVPVQLRPYWDSRSELAVSDGVIYKGMRIVIPPSLRKQMLTLIHESHLGIVKCKQRAREALYWPSMNSDIEETIQNCTKCATFQSKQPSEPLMPSPTPELPFSEVGTDLFEFESRTYLLTVDYYSKFIEVDQLLDQRSKTTIQALKAQFARHGIPKVVRSDSGPQFCSDEFTAFGREYGFTHKTSSPYCPSVNGEAERAVQTVKRLWRKAADRQLALLDYRTTPLEGINLSPAQLLMGRRPRNKLPTSRELLSPTMYNRKDLVHRLNEQKNKQKFYHDRKSANELPPLHPGDQVRMEPLPRSKQWSPGVIISHHKNPRSYIVQCGDRRYRRNRRQLRPSTQAANEGQYQWACPDFNNSAQPDKAGSCDQRTEHTDEHPSQHEEIPAVPDMATPQSTVPYITRSGRAVHPPKRLDL